MELKRLIIRRMDDEMFATDDGIAFDVVNEKDVPDGAQDGIFSIDRERGTARFESRQARGHILRVRRTDTKDTRTNRVSINGTDCTQLLDGDINVTVTPEEALVDAPGLTDEVREFLGALALEGLNLSTPAVSKALQYILKGRR